MRTVLLLVLGLLFLLPSAESPRVLLTAFKPFAGRGVNGSTTVVNALAHRLAGRCAVEVLVMDVVWDAPTTLIPPRVQAFKPDLILGFGEGHPGFLAIETRAVNRAVGADEQRTSRDGPLQTDGPAARSGRLRFVAEPGSVWPIPILISTEAGTFLCNQALWTIAGTNAARAGFIHVPPQGGTPDPAYLQPLVAALEGIVLSNLPGTR